MKDRVATFWVIVFLVMALLGAYGMHAGWFHDAGCVGNPQAGTCD